MNDVTIDLMTSLLMTSAGVTHLEYEHSECSGDWGYPMDLCAGLYRIEDIR